MRRRLHCAITAACYLHDPAAAGERPRAVDQRRGIVLSRVRHDTGDQDRSVLYQASLSELFVPYQDPDEPWNHQAYFDLGTYPSVLAAWPARWNRAKTARATLLRAKPEHRSTALTYGAIAVSCGTRAGGEPHGGTGTDHFEA